MHATPLNITSVRVSREIAGVSEDHAYEQYFFDESTRNELLDLLYARHARPLFLCAPSLALDAEARGQSYVLLDRDERFAFLPNFRSLDLEAPTTLASVDEYDAVLCDPPFANFELANLRKVLDVLAGDDAARRAAPLYLCYNSRRETAIAEAFLGSGRELVRWEGGKRGGALGYTSVKPSTQQHIRLYCER